MQRLVLGCVVCIRRAFFGAVCVNAVKMAMGKRKRIDTASSGGSAEETVAYRLDVPTADPEGPSSASKSRPTNTEYRLPIFGIGPSWSGEVVERAEVFRMVSADGTKMWWPRRSALEGGTGPHADGRVRVEHWTSTSGSRGYSRAIGVAYREHWTYTARVESTGERISPVLHLRVGARVDLRAVVRVKSRDPGTTTPRNEQLQVDDIDCDGPTWTLDETAFVEVMLPGFRRKKQLRQRSLWLLRSVGRPRPASSRFRHGRMLSCFRERVLGFLRISSLKGISQARKRPVAVWGVFGTGDPWPVTSAGSRRQKEGLR